jgi:DNA-binding NarL/FixJ family response regulator
LADVATRFGELGLPILSAEAWTQASESFRATGRARQHLNAAARATELLDALEPLDRPPAAPGRPAESPLRISRREREVAHLAADGHTNREIAEQLCLSERTVENHLYRVFAKLGIRSRRELSRALDTRWPRN